jgi:transcriptional regulator with XRE-family HTH domain
MRLKIPQDKLGVMLGLDEHTASARISRYENGIHEPPLKIAKLIADALKVPLAYLYCDDDKLAQIILAVSKLSNTNKEKLIEHLDSKS